MRNFLNSTEFYQRPKGALGLDRANSIAECFVATDQLVEDCIALARL